MVGSFSCWHAWLVTSPRTVFVARALVDADYVTALRDHLPLASNWWTVIPDVPRVPHWVSIAESSILAANAFAFVSSRAFFESQWCLHELEYAMHPDVNKPIVRIDRDPGCAGSLSGRDSAISSVVGHGGRPLTVVAEDLLLLLHKLAPE